MDRRFTAAVWAGALASTVAGCTLDPMLSDRLGHGDGGGSDASDGDAGGEMTTAVPHVADVFPAPHGLLTVFGTGPEDVWVAGEEGALARFDGRDWRAFSTPVTAPLRGLHGTGPSDVWAVGEHTILHFDGEAWVEVLRDPRETLLDVWVSPRGEAWIAGHSDRDDRALLRRWDGVEWHRHVLTTALTFWAVWGSQDGQVWIAGTAIDGNGLVLRGTADGVDPAGYVGPSIRDIWGESDDSVWVAAYQGGFQHWDGERWSQYAAPDDARVMAATGSDAEHAWAVGLRGLILGFDGDEWTAEESGANTTLLSVWAAAEDDVWAVGSDATLLHRDGEGWVSAATVRDDAIEND